MEADRTFDGENKKTYWRICLRFTPLKLSNIQYSINCSCHAVPYTLFIYFSTESVYLLTPYTHFAHFHPSFSSGNHQYVLCTYELGFYLVLLSDATYKWGYIIFVVFYLTYFKPSTVPSRFMHVVDSGKISFFSSSWMICLCICMYVCVYHIFFIHSLTFFYRLAVVSNAAVNMEVHVPFWVSAITFFG